ncbi:MAG: alpha/beta fold hydrolase [Mycobacterium sp.]|nr:alpha/beta fold hydrolase [Mycobacterium sp.]
MAVRRLIVLACALVAVLGVAAPASARTPLPVTYDFFAGARAELANPGGSLPGTNDYRCRPSAAHPDPVILVHGTGGNRQTNWATLAPALANAGYCVFALTYGTLPGSPYPISGLGGLTSMVDSSRQLGAFVDRVRAATGAAKVDIVGHSQGGMMPRYYLKFLDGARSVDHLIGLAPSNHGTTVLGLSAIPGVPEALRLGLGTAIRQQIVGSDFLRKLNSGGDTVPGVQYTVIETRYDEVVTPYTSAFLSGPDVTNITLQDGCPQDYTDHLAITYDRLALSHVLHALDASYPVAPCTFSSPLSGA